MDNIFTEETNIDTLFTEIGLPAVNATLEGFNSCIIMYGATKTGKSAIFWGNNPQEQIGAFDQLGVRFIFLILLDSIKNIDFFQKNTNRKK